MAYSIQHTSGEHQEMDAKRDEELSKWGISVLRYSNKDINQNFNAVADDIMLRLGVTFEDLK